MGRDLIEKLRRQQALVTLPDGREGVPVTLQYRGTVPPLDRARRKQWLQKQFGAASEQIGITRLVLKPETVSASAQTVEGVCAVEDIETATAIAIAAGLRVDVQAKQQIL